jgi:pimeloyl-ACP methyl ester carboxylesterase
MVVPPYLVLILGLAIVALLAYALGRFAYGAMIGIEIRDESRIEAEALARGDASPADFALPWAVEEIASPRGYTLALRSLRGEVPALAVFHHGVTWSWVGMIRYMSLFRELGWSVVAFDCRGHGSSGGGKPSYGVFEREDLKAVVDWAVGRFPIDAGLAVVGESMGAATVLQYAPLDPRVDAFVADCPYSTAREELDAQLRRSFVPFFLRPAVIGVADRLCRRREGFSLSEADSAGAILRTEAPILLVHGLDDRYVPWRMSVEMAERRRRALPDSITELRLVEGARHGRSISVDRAGYAACLNSFLAMALAARGKGA